MASIIFDGVSSKEFGLRLVNEVVIESTSHDIEKRTVMGRDGDLTIDRQRLNSVVRSFPFVVQPTDGRTVHETTQAISGWLNKRAGYREMILSWDPDYVYQAHLSDNFSVEEIVKTFGRLYLTFNFEPTKKLIVGQKPIMMTTGMNLKNLGNVKAKPYLEITGRGDGFISINGRETKFANLQGKPLIYDVEKNIMKAGGVSGWRYLKLISERPYLDLGDNRIEKSANLSVKMIPNWAVML